ncbi:MAG TPA: histidine--tRNA ligase [Patescibacteria group bacterium]|nr:histidine--tRNA ligase [Patescibacteria group bacterium]
MERLPGFRDFYPEPLPQPDLWSADARQYVFERWRSVAQRYGFREYDGPPLEPLELFTLKSGEEIVGQLYNFSDKGKREVSLRPEMTPTLARMVAAHERNYKKPIKWFALPQLFRYERPQKGRLREHFQLNADIIGETDPAADAELIALLIDILRSFELNADDFFIRISSRNAWQAFYKQNNGDPAREYEFYQVIDKLEREEPPVSEQKLSGLGIPLQRVQSFIEEAKPTQELQTILDNLVARGLEAYVKIDYGVIRGLAYYTGTVFEAFDRKGDFRAVAGGGRYDNLVNLISGGKVNLPALGFGMGDVVLVELLKARERLPRFKTALDAVCIIEDESLRPDSLKLIQELRSAGIAVDYSFVPAKPDKQFKRAQELGAAHVVKLERLASGELIVKKRDMGTRQETIIIRSEVLKHLSSR